MARAAREVWQERVRRWSKSGKNAKAFAAEIGVNANTLTGWRWRLAREGQDSRAVARRPRGRGRTEDRRDPAAVGFLELVASAGEPSAEDRFEIVLEGGRVVRVPRRFDPDTLRALVAALEVR